MLMNLFQEAHSFVSNLTIPLIQNMTKHEAPESVSLNLRNLQEEIDLDPRRYFTASQKTECFLQAKNVPKRDPERWKYDTVGNIVFRKYTNCYGALCHQYDHIYPWSLGGRTTVENCQILQSDVNNFKSDKVDVPFDELQQSSEQMNI